MLHIRYYDHAHRGPIFEAEAHGMMLDGGMLVVLPYAEHIVPTSARFAEVWNEAGRLFGGPCNTSERGFFPVDGAKPEVDADFEDVLARSTAEFQQRMRDLVRQLGDED